MRNIVAALMFVAFFPTPANADFRAGFPIPKPNEQMIAYKLAQCIVESDLSGAEQVVSTLPGSKENEKANRSLVPTVEACWNSGANGNLSIGTHLLRGSLAEVLYHQAVAKAGARDPNPYSIPSKD